MKKEVVDFICSLFMTEIVAPESNMKVVSLLFMCPNISNLMPEVSTSSIVSVQLEIRSLFDLFEFFMIEFKLGFSIGMSRGDLISTS